MKKKAVKKKVAKKVAQPVRAVDQPKQVVRALSKVLHILGLRQSAEDDEIILHFSGIKGRMQVRVHGIQTRLFCSRERTKEEKQKERDSEDRTTSRPTGLPTDRR